MFQARRLDMQFLLCALCIDGSFRTPFIAYSAH